MALSTRERSITLIVLAACALFVLDRLAIEPYLDFRKSLVQERQRARLTLERDQKLLDMEQRLRRRLAMLTGKIKGDPAAAEDQLFRLVNDFEQQAGVGGTSFQRIRTADEHGYTTLAYHVSASGNMPAIAMLMYRIETAGIPLRVDDVQVAPRRDAGDELVVQMNVSTLARPDTGEQDTHVASTGGNP